MYNVYYNNCIVLKPHINFIIIVININSTKIIHYFFSMLEGNFTESNKLLLL